MGSFFTSVQVHRGQLSKDAARLRLAEAITGWLAEQGYRPAGDREAADREVVIPSGGDWLSVYDSGTEGQDDRLLAALAERASAALGDAVGVLVHDSDVLTLSLARDGATVDTYSNAPGYFDAVPEAVSDALAGKPEQWSALVDDTAPLTDLWRRGAGEAEGILWDMAPLIGWERDRVMVGFNYRDEQDGDLRLSYRLSERPYHETRSGGLPRFNGGGHPIEQESSVGEELTLYCSAQSAGGAGAGVAIVAWGPALDEGLITMDKAAIILMKGGQHQRVEASFEASVTDGARGEQSRVRVARFPDVAIPAGVPMDALMRAPAGAQKAAMEALFSAQISFHAFGRALKPGARALHLAVVPAANRDGSTRHTVGVKVRAETRKPLRWSGRPESNDALRELSTPDTLFALVSLSNDVPHALIAETLEAWHARIHELYEGSWHVSKYLKNGQLKTGTIAPKAIPRWKSWRGLLELARGEKGFSASRATGPWLDGEDPVFTNDGFSCTTAYEWGYKGQRPARHLGLWVDLSARPPELGDALQPLLVALVDRLAEAGARQALVGRWRWSPGGDVSSTPYERACGISGQIATTVAWSQRFLRGVTPTIWLGPELLGRVAPSPHAEVTSLGRGARLDRAEGSTLDELEQALAPILPSEADSRAAVTPG